MFNRYTAAGIVAATFLVAAGTAQAGKDLDAVVKEWVDKNEAVWKPWVDAAKG